MKTKEELQALKDKAENLNKKLAELTEEELKQVVGGDRTGKILVRAGDTWASIAARFATDVDTLQELNPGVTLRAGIFITVPFFG